jgi:DNA-binding CsgD family transcriptional regulator
VASLQPGVRRSLRDLEDLILTVHLGARSEPWQTICERIQESFGMPTVGFYTLRQKEHGFERARTSAAGAGASHICRFVDEMLSASEGPPYDPMFVPRFHQNKVRSWNELASSGLVPRPVMEAYAERVRRLSGFALQDQVRAIVSHGATMLVWIGGLFGAERPSTPVDRTIFRALLPPIRTRALFERQAARDPLLESTLEAVLEGLAEPVFLVDARGRPALMNTAAATLWQTERSGARASIGRALAGAADTWRVTKIESRGLPPHFLLMGRPTRLGARARVAQAARAWSLTAREEEVLLLLAEGHMNQSIARQLDCAERTIELHVTNLFRKSRSENRATLIALVWGGA